MFLKHLDLTSALRPSLSPGEILLFTQDNVGLYEDKYKIASYQNGQVYLTSHRICYIDNLEPRKNCVAVELKDVETYLFYGGFMKSSPKITLVPKTDKLHSGQNRPLSRRSDSGTASLSHLSFNSTRHCPSGLKNTTSATWICPICSFSNLVPTNFDPITANDRTPVPPCSTCGVKPQWTLVLKAAVSSAAQDEQENSLQDITKRTRLFESTGPLIEEDQTEQRKNPRGVDVNSFQCPRCTFINHPSLLACELCNAPLITHETQHVGSEKRTESPGPVVNPIFNSKFVNIKISFRSGGEKIFYERLKASMVQRKWLSHGAPPVPTPDYSNLNNHSSNTTAISEVAKTGGIAGLEARRLQERQKNERVIGTAFEDLEALMSSAQEILALAESFSSKNGKSNSDSDAVASALGLVTTKEMLSNNSEHLYITELTRNLVEFLTDDSRGILSKAGGIISLVDLWAKFNRARGGVELVSPNDFAKAAHHWEDLKLPFRLRKFKSGVLVVQGNEHTDHQVNKSIRLWMEELHAIPPEHAVAWDWQTFGHAVSAQEAAEHFGWSLGIAEEELEMAEEEGTLCREEGIEGTKYWTNHFNS
ncbi:hypothetical protein Golomagni_04724 [Golovinomyces magnicellulatus]|nr:hypothetical protein Golomagni_04724 [Golovinomyces magnicellulatus]